MKMLLDECITKHLKKYLTDFEVYTVNQMGWSGVKNGNLMKLCVDNGFDVLLTIDKNLIFQNNTHKYELAIVVLNSRTSKIEELCLFADTLKEQASNFTNGKSYILEI